MVSLLYKANFSDLEHTECSQETLLLVPTKNTINHRDRVKQGLFILSIALHPQLNVRVLTLTQCSRAHHLVSLQDSCSCGNILPQVHTFTISLCVCGGGGLICSQTKLLGSTSLPGKATRTELVYLLRSSVKYLMGTNGEEEGIGFKKVNISDIFRKHNSLCQQSL